MHKIGHLWQLKKVKFFALVSNLCSHIKKHFSFLSSNRCNVPANIGRNKVYGDSESEYKYQVCGTRENAKFHVQQIQCCQKSVCQTLSLIFKNKIVISLNFAIFKYSQTYFGEGYAL